MFNKEICLKLLVINLVFVISAVNCFGQSTDSRLNGTWVMPAINGTESSLVFNNGMYEDIRGGEPYEKGTYTTNNGIIIFQKTHRQSWVDGENRLLSKNETRQIRPYSFPNDWFDPYQLNYSINGNRLTITDDGEDFTYTRKN